MASSDSAPAAPSASTPGASPVASVPLRYGPPIRLAMAKQVMAAAEAAAIARGWPMAIAIADSTGHLVLFHRVDDTQHGSTAIAMAKAATAVDFRRPTHVFEDAVAAGGAGLRLLATPGLVPIDGGLPLVVDGAVIGAIGVSGMPAPCDGEIAAIGAAALEAAP